MDVQNGGKQFDRSKEAMMEWNGICSSTARANLLTSCNYSACPEQTNSLSFVQQPGTFAQPRQGY